MLKVLGAGIEDSYWLQVSGAAVRGKFRRHISGAANEGPSSFKAADYVPPEILHDIPLYMVINIHLLSSRLSSHKVSLREAFELKNVTTNGKSPKGGEGSAPKINVSTIQNSGGGRV